MRISDWSSDVCSSDLLPLGGLIETPFVTAHLDPVEAQRLDSQVQEAIEQTIDDWICEHRLYDRPRARREIDRATADPEARAVIASREIGRAACRERGGQYGWISVGAVSFKKQQIERQIRK